VREQPPLAGRLDRGSRPGARCSRVLRFAFAEGVHQSAGQTSGKSSELKYVAASARDQHPRCAPAACSAYSVSHAPRRGRGRPSAKGMRGPSLGRALTKDPVEPEGLPHRPAGGSITSQATAISTDSSSTGNCSARPSITFTPRFSASSRGRGGSIAITSPCRPGVAHLSPSCADIQTRSLPLPRGRSDLMISARARDHHPERQPAHGLSESIVRVSLC
jgi:hypothetical protein